MAEINSKHIISSLTKKWKLALIGSSLLTAVAIAIVLTAIVTKLLSVSWWYVAPVFAATSVILLFAGRYHLLTDRDVAGFLNRQYPELEESTVLVLKPYESLNFLQRLQLKKIEPLLSQLEPPAVLRQKLRNSGIILLCALVAASAIYKVPFPVPSAPASEVIDQPSSASSLMPEVMLPGITSVSIQVNPPAYTRNIARKQDKFNLLVEEGAMVKWNLGITGSPKTVKLIFNDNKALILLKKNATWSAARRLTKPGFYRVVINGKASEFYKVEIIKDNPPSLKITAPQPRTTIDFGNPPFVTVKFTATDDYGINTLTMPVTTSSGSGEAVKFKEFSLSFRGFTPGGKNYNIQKVLDCKALGMQPGDELYFYVLATDNKGQEKRSDVYVITLPDTTGLMSMDGLVNSLDIKPEYFRSQRQIILETEQLLRDKDTLATTAFNNRSNNLGVDQKLLRLRYGKFLGEETDEEIGHEEHGNATQGETPAFGDAAAVIDQFSHKHDNAEDATFFEPEQKAQLKATLAEMWKAELQLRLNKPREALPFEYKALRLLKDLQQKSRVYVAKTGFKATPLKPGKRLSGELDKVIQPQSEKLVKEPKDLYENSRRSVGLLQMLQAGQSLSPRQVEVLQKANTQLYEKAALQPVVYLPAVAAFRNIFAAIKAHHPATKTDIANALRGLQHLMAAHRQVPAPWQQVNYRGLANDYFRRLE